MKPRRLAFIATFTILLAAAILAAQSTRRLEIYWIDVEGGASTLIVTPQGQSVLVDTGYEGFDDRDAKRIEHVIRNEARLTRLDYVLISHFHSDHAGGLGALARRIEIGAFVDHGELVEPTPEYKPLFDRYVALAGTRRRIVKPGDRLPLQGAELVVVAADGQVLTKALSGSSPNASCAEFTPQPEDKGENARSLGFLFRAGRFEFVNLGDLSWNVQHQLACPVNVLGKIDLFQVTHHGTRDDVLPQQMWPMAPAVAVMNNSPTKGAGPVAVEAVLRSPGLEGLWSLHRAAGNDAAHNAKEQLTANLGPSLGCPGNWIRMRMNADESYTLTNSRTGYVESYRVR